LSSEGSRVLELIEDGGRSRPFGASTSDHGPNVRSVLSPQKRAAGRGILLGSKLLVRNRKTSNSVQLGHREAAGPSQQAHWSRIWRAGAWLDGPSLFFEAEDDGGTIKRLGSALVA
jgi:hypothetical protein